MYWYIGGYEVIDSYWDNFESKEALNVHPHSIVASYASAETVASGGTFWIHIGKLGPIHV